MSANKHTPGPWYWRISRKSRSVDLVSATSGRPYVMGFRRYGMTGAQPQFNTEMIMVSAHDLAVDIPGQEHNNEWNQTISHPNAHLIAAAPDLYSALVEILDASNIAELPTREESERLDRAEEAARAAIKKARGAP